MNHDIIILEDDISSYIIHCDNINYPLHQHK